MTTDLGLNSLLLNKCCRRVKLVDGNTTGGVRCSHECYTGKLLRIESWFFKDTSGMTCVLALEPTAPQQVLRPCNSSALSKT